MTRDEAAKHLQAVLDGRIRGTRKDTDAVRTILTHGYAPEGKVIVPREPTYDMIAAGDYVAVIRLEYGEDAYIENTEEIYFAMLSAAEKETGQ